MDSREAARLTREFEELMAVACNHLNPEWKCGEVMVLKTAKGNTYVAEIPDFQDWEIREPLENRCIEEMAAKGDTQVLACLATVNGQVPEILSWNFRSRLIELDNRNLEAICFLWGGENKIIVKPFRSLR